MLFFIVFFSLVAIGIIYLAINAQLDHPPVRPYVSLLFCVSIIWLITVGIFALAGRLPQ